MALAPGTRPGLYEIAAQIDVGGMGEVYRAADTKLDRDAAIKFWLAASAAMLVMLPVPLLAQENGTFEVQAVRASEPTIIDGELTEADWALAEPVTDFFQKEPQEGAPASEATEVRILFDTRQLYIGVVAHDSDPSGIRATELRRDDQFDNDDIFELVLDTFHDHRNGYLFRINPLGTLHDATITNEGQNTNRNWDEQWEATTQITDEGWVAEIAIPFKSLRFEASEELTWGINFHREIKRKNEDVYWTAYSRDLSFDELSQAGHLEGLSEIQGFTFRIKPFFTSGGSQVVRRGLTETDHLTDIGIEDAKFMITPQLVLDMTVNPDFGQADVDEAQVNLTRFSRFFAERREFFQEGAGIFQFGSGGFGRPDLLLFHSRRIGLSDNREEVPIWGGLKLTGQQGPLEVGVLNMQTRRSGRDEVTPGQNFSVVRLKANLLGRSYVGTMFTSNTAGAEGSDNKAGGVDASFTFFQNLNLRGFLARTDPAPTEKAEWAGQGTIEWQTDLFEVLLEHTNVPREDNFNPGIGFVGRNDQKENQAEFSYQPRPDVTWIRQFGLEAGFARLTNQEGVLETRGTDFGLSTDFESGDAFDVGVERVFERLLEPFRVRGGGGTVPAGDYTFNQYSMMYRAFRGRMISGNLQFQRGGFFNGHRTRFGISPRFTPSQNLSLEPGYDWNRISLPGSTFTTHEFNGDVNYSFNQRWLTRTTLLLDSQGEEYTFNFRLNYIYRPGDDVFVVYTETRTYGDVAGLDNRALIVKSTFSFDY